MSNTLNVVIIEDDVEMASYLQDVLHEAGYLAHQANTGSKGLHLIKHINPDLVLLDLELPDISGRDLCRQIKHNLSRIKVIMVTNHDSSQDIVTGLNIGADDYLCKPINSDELLARINALFRSSKIGQTVLQVGDLELNQQSHEVSRAKKKIILSAQEFKLLQYMMRNANTVLTRNMILSRIWDNNPDIETRVVDVYIGYLRKKIDFKKPQLINTIRGFGYSLKTPVLKN